MKFQDESTAAFHVAGLHATMGRDSRVAHHSIALGGRIARNNIRARLDGTGIEAVLNGLYLPRGKQLIDHHMVVDHLQPHCDSHEYFNGILDDHARLRQMPKGSFAHAYCDFMEREGLTAAGLVEASGDTRNGMEMLEDGVEWYGDRLRDTHDILHILTGYGRDTLGEQCVLAFLFHQRPSPGHLFVAWAGTLLMKVKLRTRAPILGALLEARRHGRLTQRIVEQPILDLLPMQLDEVRARLNVRTPSKYLATLDIFREESIDPHAFLAKQAG